MSLEDLLLLLSERLLSNAKSIRVSNMSREPYVDYLEDEKSVMLTAELSGVRPEDVLVVAGRDSIELIVNRKNSGTFQEVCKTPRIRPESAKIRLNNNILEVTADKV